MSPWSWIYLFGIVLALSISLGLRQKTYVKISSIILLAFCGTRLITEFAEGNRFMYDMSNDLAAVVLLLIFTKESMVAKTIILLYALMTAFAYIPSTITGLILHTHFVIIDILAYIQIFFIYGGMAHGFWTRRPLNANIDRKYNMAYVSRSDIVNSSSKPKRNNEPFRSGTHADMAKDS